MYFPLQEAALARGLLENDNEWHLTLEEASPVCLPHQLRELFASILAFCNPSDPSRLWLKHKDALCDDILHRAQQEMRASGLQPSGTVEFSSVHEMDALRLIDDSLQGMGSSLSKFPTLPQPPPREDRGPQRLIHQQLALDSAASRKRVAEHARLLTEEQKAIVATVLRALDDPDPKKNKVFMLQGSAGSGKSFLLNHILDRVRERGSTGISLAVASSGIASQLLVGGTTAHFRFKIPLHVIDDCATCDVAKGSAEALLFREAKLIAWDEAPMMQAHVFSAVDRTLGDVCDNAATLFAGKVFLMSGDFRQLLPIIEYGSSRDCILACIKNYPRIWDVVTVLNLTRNMRLEHLAGSEAAEQRGFAEWLLRVGDGTEREYPAVTPHAILLPPSIVAEPSGVDALISRIFDPARLGDKAYVSERAILTPLNADVDDINARVLKLFAGPSITYVSVDTLEHTLASGDDVFYSPEMLAMLTAAGLPPARLELKVGMIVILLRNLNGNNGQASTCTCSLASATNLDVVL